MSQSHRALGHYLATVHWTPERREAAAQRWRERWPERAAIRDEILATKEPGPCDLCGSNETTLYVTDYGTRAFVWRCRPCAKAMRQNAAPSAGAP
jgi:hypothetical protein